MCSEHNHTICLEQERKALGMKHQSQLSRAALSEESQALASLTPTLAL